MNLKINLENVGISIDEIKNYRNEAEKAIDELWDIKAENTGWVKSPMSTSEKEIEEIINTALAAQDSCGLFIVIGNGSSIGGAKAAVEALDEKIQTAPEVEFVGGDISPTRYAKIIEKMRHYEVNVCVISKSGETLETLLAYEIIKDAMVLRYGEENAAKRIMIMTGEGNNTLRLRGKEDGCGVFKIPTDIKGGYGIFSISNLLIMSVAGLDIKRLMSGAEVMATDPMWDVDASDYAIARRILKENGKVVEFISFDNPNLETFALWLSHIFAESEGKENQGIFTTPMNLSRDFKSYANFLKDERDEFFSTEIGADKLVTDIEVPLKMRQRFSKGTANEINEILSDKMARARHKETSDFISIRIPEMNEFQLGQMMYFFLMSAAVSAKVFGVDPFESGIVDEMKKELSKEKVDE